jgi:hypothetical protein
MADAFFDWIFFLLNLAFFSSQGLRPMLVFCVGQRTLESGSQLGYTSSGDPGPPLHLDPGVFSSPQEMFPQVKNLRIMNLHALAFVSAASVAVTLFAVVSFFMLNW